MWAETEAACRSCAVEVVQVAKGPLMQLASVTVVDDGHMHRLRKHLLEYEWVAQSGLAMQSGLPRPQDHRRKMLAERMSRHREVRRFLEVLVN